MLRPRYVVTAFFSGSKGGTGKSTLASNLSILLSRALRSYVLLIDLGVDSSQTSSRALGIAPDRPGVLDYLVGSVNDAVRLVDRSTYMPSVFVVPPGTVRSYQVNASIREVYPRWVNLVNSLVLATNAQLVLIDLPANAPTALLVPALVTSQVINVVLDQALYSEYVLREIDDTYIQPMLSQLGYRKIVNVVLNKALPGMDGVEAKVRGYVRNGEVFIIPTSPIAQYLTAMLRPAVLYEARGSLAQFRKSLEAMAASLARQVKAVLTGAVD